MAILIILFLATCFLAYSNGANDNFKGVATLFGSKTTNYKYAVGWATITTFPISTTHSLTGALVGAGFVAVGSQVNFAVLGSAFFMPLLLSPVIATALGSGLYIIFRNIRIRSGITKEWCICVGEQRKAIPSCMPAPALSVKYGNTIGAALDTEENCQEIYQGRFLGINSQKLLDSLHFCSAW